MKDTLPAIEDCLKRQGIWKREEDLASWRQRKILLCAPKTPHEYITQVGDMRFQVCSSKQEKLYEVELLNNKCTCLDFPRIEFCKHIASTQHYFGGTQVEPQPSNLSSLSSLIAPASYNTKSRKATSDGHTTASLISVTNKIIALSQQLLMQTPNPEAISNMVKSLRLVHSHLAAVVMSATRVGPQLPEREQIAPNQHSWTETAERMGVKRGNKACSKVDSARTAEHIGEINRKRNRENDDPYGAGEQSGKHAKPDARSAVANANARACATMEPSRPLSSSRGPAPVPFPVHHYIPSPLPLSQPAPRPTSPLPLPVSLPPRLSTPHTPGPLLQVPYYPPPSLLQPAPFVPQFTQYQYPFQTPYYPFHHPSQ
ncbi:hypothetical protein EDB87DRAFT_1582998 [Lactarius vividus]|nr:hypothetical protein EDB87DRAFT_1582998 [Lactarius vividus]